MKSFWEIRILLVETNESVIRLVEKTLSESRLKHFLRWVRTPQDLEFELQFNVPDLILSGRNMGLFSAIEVLILNDKHGNKAPCIIITSDRDIEQDIELALHGVYEIFTLEEIKLMVKEIGFLKEQLQNQKITA
jgi:DNA-binding NtrC family response regulator